jgi:hypothetical protein
MPSLQSDSPNQIALSADIVAAHVAHYHDGLTDRQRIRIHAHTKHEQLKVEALDILIDAVHLQMYGGATVSFDHNLASKIEKLIAGDMPRAKIISLVRTGSIRVFDCTTRRHVLNR